MTPCQLNYHIGYFLRLVSEAQLNQSITGKHLVPFTPALIELYAGSYFNIDLQVEGLKASLKLQVGILVVASRER